MSATADRMAALNRQAHEVKRARCYVREFIGEHGRSEGLLILADLLEDPPTYMERLDVMTVLCWPTRTGEHLAQRTLTRVRYRNPCMVLSEKRLVGSLTERERRALARQLRREAYGRGGA